MLVDLSHVLEPDMPTYPGVESPELGASLTHAESAERAVYAPGTTFQLGYYRLPGNTGTYIDSPFHRHPDLADLADLELTSIANLAGVVVDAPESGPIGPATLGGLDLAHKAVLFRTGWSKLWGGQGYFASGPFLTGATSRLLIEAAVALVGIDCANVDDMADRSRPAHTLLLAAGIPIVEHLCGLHSLPNAAFRFFAVPPAIRGGSSFPVRAFVLLE